jgi:hypothetical protein
VQEEFVVGAQEVEDLVADEDEQSVDGVPVHPIGRFEAFVLPDCHLFVEGVVEPLLETSPRHYTPIKYIHHPWTFLMGF